MRKLGDIIFDLEALVGEMVQDHDLQRGDVLAIIFNYINVHQPESIEEYEEDDSNPIYFYGHKDTFKLFARKL